MMTSRFARLSVRAVVMGGVAWLAACAPTQVSQVPPRAELAVVTLAGGERGSSDAAVLAMALGWAGQNSPPTTAARLSQGGDGWVAVAAAAQEMGRLAYPVRRVDAMAREVAAGHPVLVRRPGWGALVMVVGYDLGRDLVLVQGIKQTEEMGLSSLTRNWSDEIDNAMVILPPGDVPATVDRAAYERAAAGILRRGPAFEAVLAFDAGLSMWPDNPTVLMGLGKGLYALGDREGAADAFDHAARVARDPRSALINLAEVLDELGRRDESRAVARKAVFGNPPPVVNEAVLRD